MLRTRIATLTAATLLAGTAAQAADPVARAELHATGGEKVGDVTFYETADGLLLRANVSGLDEGWHGFHIHETGECAGDFSSAGGHYAPRGNGHGFYTADGGHAGDLPNIHADESNKARAAFHTERVSLNGEAPLMDADGSAIIVHANADSYEDEAGAAGRVACGVVEPVGS